MDHINIILVLKQEGYENENTVSTVQTDMQVIELTGRATISKTNCLLLKLTAVIRTLYYEL